VTPLRCSAIQLKKLILSPELQNKESRAIRIDPWYFSNMESLDLTTHPPRSPYQKMEGVFMLPRTIDKLRANLPGGKIGAYTIRGSSPLLPGLSLVLLDGIGVTEQRLLEVVERASVEEEIAEWLRQNGDLSTTAALNKKLLGRRIEDVQAVVPPAVIAKVYPCMNEMAKTTPMFEVLLEDDRFLALRAE
jgi:uncharacterized protein DUF5069